MDIDIDPIYIVGIPIGLVIFCLLSYVFYRWIFSIKRQLWNQRQQINLLIKIAKKLGVENDEDLRDVFVKNNNANDEPIKL